MFDWLNRKRVVGIVDNQFGDTGKGKFVNLFTNWADVTVRGTGGANAGHTVCVGDEKYFLHLVPSGVTHDDHQKEHIIGRGVALDPKCLLDELEVLRAGGLACNNLLVSTHAKLVMPYHLLEDRLRECLAGGKKIGTTGRGIGPVYQDHVARLGLTVNDLLNVDLFAQKMMCALMAKLPALRSFDPDVVREIMCHSALGGGKYYESEHAIFNPEAIIADYRLYGERLDSMVCDTDEIVQNAIQNGKRVLLEGAQGLLLSVDYGTYPYVTSSDCSIHGLAVGAGLTMRDVDEVLGVTKAFHMSRVGEGPFPTEMGGEQSRAWCATATRQSEAITFPDANLQSDNSFLLGVAIRKHAGEYGTTTGRARRIGWLDLPLLRHAIRVNGPNLALTMLDVLDECPTIRICTAYTYEGPPVRLGSKMIKTGECLGVAIPDSHILQHCVPIYEEFPGWECPLTDVRSAEDLPEKLMELVDVVEEGASAKVRFLSVGPDRDQTIAL